MITIGIDTGGTFTDFVVCDGDTIRTHKQLSTPARPEQAILSGLRELGVELHGTQLVHGSTVATNTLLEGKGAKTVFITNRGFADILTIGRQARAELYNLTPQPVSIPVAPELCLETGGRVGSNGELIDPLTEADLEQLLQALKTRQPQAVAVSLLFSFINPQFEQTIKQHLPDDVFVSLSSEVLPEYREYERSVATWLNACTGPVMQGYLERLASAIAPAALSVMQSSAVSCTPEFAARRAVNLLLSGPAGGLLGAGHIAAQAGHQHIMTFDMGGTSTDVALIDGAIKLTSEGRIGAYPVGVPMVDMHTIGAGGGSIARLDAGGLLHVGPQSAGAVPGPACYGAGGREATVTDANLVLGRLPRSTRLAGTIPLDLDAARRALQMLADAMGGLSIEAVAEGIIDLANDHMRQALRVISVERGIDARDFTLLSFGGAGGLHVCALAKGLGMHQALVPADAGVLSALGMVVARPGRRLSRTVRRAFASLDDAAIRQLLEEVAEPGVEALLSDGHARRDLRCDYSADVCYRGQSFALNLAWSSLAEVAQQFHREHERRYGHQLAHPLELVNLRAAVDVDRPTPNPVYTPRSQSLDPSADGPERYPVVARGTLQIKQRLHGPAIVVDPIATTFIEPGWSGSIDVFGNLLLRLDRA